MAAYKVPEAALAVAREAAQRIRALEAEALAALHEKNDPAAHRAGMTKKCLVLEALPEEAEARLPDPATPDTAAFAAGWRISPSGPACALSLESIFFMGALLYPDDYQDGQPNDLERFLDRSKRSSAVRPGRLRRLGFCEGSGLAPRGDPDAMGPRIAQWGAFSFA